MADKSVEDIKDQANTGQVTVEDFITAKKSDVDTNGVGIVEDDKIVQVKKDVAEGEIDFDNINEVLQKDNISVNTTNEINTDADNKIVKDDIDVLDTNTNSDEVHIIKGDMNVEHIRFNEFDTPASNFNGEATVTVTTTDDDGATATDTSTVTVSDVNDAPNNYQVYTQTSTQTQQQEVEVEHTREVIDTNAMNSAGYFLEDGVWTQTIQETFINTRTEINDVEVPVSAYNDEDAKLVNLNHMGSSTGIISLGHDVNAIDISIKSFKSSKDEGEIILYKDEHEVARIDIDDIYDDKGNVDTSITVDGYTFDSYEVVSLSNKQAFKIGGAVEDEDSVIATTIEQEEVEIQFEDTREVNIVVEDAEIIMTTETYTTIEIQDVEVEISFDAIDIGEGDHIVANLELADVLDMTNANNTLTIFGDKGDKVELDSTDGNEWIETDNITQIDGHSFITFTNNDASVLIEQEIPVIMG